MATLRVEIGPLSAEVTTSDATSGAFTITNPVAITDGIRLQIDLAAGNTAANWRCAAIIMDPTGAGMTVTSYLT